MIKNQFKVVRSPIIKDAPLAGSIESPTGGSPTITDIPFYGGSSLGSSSLDFPDYWNTASFFMPGFQAAQSNASGTQASPTIFAKLPGLCVDNAGGSWSWFSPNAVTFQADDPPGAGQVAGAAANSGSFTAANYLLATQFAFNVPAEAFIRGLKVDIYRNASQMQTGAPLRLAKDSNLHLVKAGSEVGSDKAATSTNYTTAIPFPVASYGGINDLWGTTWAPSDINNVNFGLRFRPQMVDASGGTTSASVDYFRITVYVYY